jgi:hypothetical protein
MRHQKGEFMTARLSAVGFALILVLSNTGLVGQAAPAGKVLVTNSNDAGPGSFRDAIEQANGDTGIGTVQFTGSVSVVALASTVVFSGQQDLSILGNGATLDGTNTGGRSFEATGGGDLSVSRLVVRNSPQEGISVLIPGSATGTVVVELNDVEIIDNAGHGIHIDDQEDDGSGSVASLDVRVTKSLFRDNGYSVSDRDGIRVDEGGIGDVTFTFFNSRSIDNAADGIEVDERGAGNVYVDVFGSDVSGNGVFDPSDLDDGFDIDESEEGSIIGRISHSSSNNNYEQGLDFNENHAGDLRVDLDHVEANNNGAEGIEYEEDDDFAGGGDIVTTMFHVTTNGNGGAFEEDPGDAGLKLREKGVGDLTATLSHIEASNNNASGVLIREDAAGSLVADVRYATALNNVANSEVDGHGIDFDENSDGDLTANVSHSTSSNNAGAGVRTDEGGSGAGSVILSFVVLDGNAGGQTTGSVTPTFN